MGRLLVTNNRNWDEYLNECFSKSGFTENGKYHGDTIYLRTYSKLNISTFNFYSEGEDFFVAVCGTLIYKSLFGSEALKALYNDLRKFSITDVRRELAGNFAVAFKCDGTLKVFVDETGTYALHYYHDNNNWLMTNTYYHVEKCARQDINTFAYMEELLAFCVIDNQTPFNNIFRLMGDEVINIDAEGFSVEKIPLNTYKLDAGTIEDTAKVLHDRIAKYSSILKLSGETPCLFVTGGTDSRLELAAYIASGQKPLLANWQGSPYSMNSIPDDQVIARQLAEKLNLDFMPISISEEGFVERDIDVAEFDTYGEHAEHYGNNRDWFGIFHNKNLRRFNFGYFGETLRGLDFLDACWKVPMTLDDYARAYTGRHAPHFTSNNTFDYDAYRDIVRRKLQDIASSNGFDAGDLSREECMYLYFTYRLHADTKMMNLANMFGYSSILFAQKELADLINQVPYEYKANDRLNLMITHMICPELMEIPYFTHCRYKKFDDKALTLTDYGRTPSLRTLAKNVIKYVIIRTGGGGILDYIRGLRQKKDIRIKIASGYARKIMKSPIAPVIGFGVDENTFNYLPMYAKLICRNACAEYALGIR